MTGIVYHRTKARWFGLVGVAIASFIGCIDFTIVNTAIPAIQDSFGASVSGTQWIVTLFVAALSAFMVVAGRLADRYGRRKVLFAGIVAFAIASIGAGAAGSIEALVAFRFVQGASAAALYTSSAAIVSNAFPDNERGRAIGLLFAGNGAGLALGPVAGGLLVGVLGWRSVFFVNVPFLVASVAICLLTIRDSRDETDANPIDWPGAGLLTAGLCCLLLGLTRGMDWGWSSPPTLIAVVGGFATLAGFLARESRTPWPLINLKLFLNRGFAIASIATFALAFFYCAAFFLMPLYLSAVRGADSELTGLMLMPTTATVALASPFVGRLTDRYGALPLLMTGLVLLALSAALQMTFTSGTGMPFVVFAFAVMGLGWGCILGPSTVAALESVAKRLGGVAMGASWTIHNVGGALGLVLATLVWRLNVASAAVGDKHFANAMNPGQLKQLVVEPAIGAVSRNHFTSGYEAAMGLLVVVTVVALVTIAGLRWVEHAGMRRAQETAALGRHGTRGCPIAARGRVAGAAEWSRRYELRGGTS